MFERVGARKTEKRVAVFMRAYGTQIHKTRLPLFYVSGLQVKHSAPTSGGFTLLKRFDKGL
jgi:hypothetical protein